MNRIYRDQLLSALWAIIKAAEEGKLLNEGICHSLRVLSGWGWFNWNNVYIPTCKQLWCDWPEFSGNPEYPIPGGEALFNCTFGHQLWQGKQGEQRIQLVMWLIQQLEEV